MITRQLLGLVLAVLFLMGGTFAFAPSGVLPNNLEAAFYDGLDLDLDDGVGPNGDPSVSADSVSVSANSDSVSD